MKGRNRSLGASAGAVVEIDGRNSVGAEFEYWRNRNGEPNDTYTDFRNAGTVTRTDSHFDKLDIRNNYSATFNYIRKIDTLGSTLKLLADYTRRETDSGNDNFSRMTAPGATADSTYRDNTESVYNIATATLALEKRFSPRWTLKAGAKYTYNDMHNDRSTNTSRATHGRATTTRASRSTTRRTSRRPTPSPRRSSAAGASWLVCAANTPTRREKASDRIISRSFQTPTSPSPFRRRKDGR